MAVLYVVGALGFSLLDGAYRYWLLALTPFNLLVTFGLLLWNEPEKKSRFWIGIFFIFLLCFGVEAIGVATGWPFGVYYYGKTLGFKVLQVPLLIGLNWVMLSLAAFSAAELVFKSRLYKILLSGVTLTLLDYQMEPVAIALDFWHWEYHVIPFENYVSWFVLSLLASTLASYTQKEPNPFGIWLLGIQFFFFLTLNLTL